MSRLRCDVGAVDAVRAARRPARSPLMTHIFGESPPCLLIRLDLPPYSMVWELVRAAEGAFNMMHAQDPI